MKKLGAEEIRAIRIFGRMTQEEFARLLGVTVSTVNRWERGKCRPLNAFVRRMLELDNNGIK